MNDSSSAPNDSSIPPSMAELDISGVLKERRTDPATNLPGLETLRLSQSFQEEVGVKKALTTVPVRKPDRQWWLRTHPDENWRLTTAILESKQDRETYLVDRSIWDDLGTEIVPKVLVTSVNRQGVLFLWPIRLPSADGRLDDYNRSALEAAARAQHGWVRVAANMAAGAYDVFETSAAFAEPQWPAISFHALLSIAFKDRYITSLDHPVVRRLRGEI